MSDQLDSPRARRSLRSRGGAPDSPQVQQSPSNLSNKGGKKSPASQQKGKNKSPKLKTEKEISDDSSDGCSKAVNYSVEGICTVVKDVQERSKGTEEGGDDNGREMYGVHEEVMLEESIKDEVGSEDGKEMTNSDDIENVCERLDEQDSSHDVPEGRVGEEEEEEPCDDLSTLLDDSGAEHLQTVPPPPNNLLEEINSTPSSVILDKANESVPPAIDIPDENIGKENESVPVIAVPEESIGKEKDSIPVIAVLEEGIHKENDSVPAIVISDEAVDDDITLIYEDEPPKIKRSSSNIEAAFIELDRVGEVDETGNDDDVVTIVDEDEDMLQELEAIRSVGQGSERGESILNTSMGSTGAATELIDFGDDYGFSDEEIELSGDEENFDRQDVTMMLIKRPPLKTVHVECYDILDSDEEFPVCLAQGEKKDPVNIEEKRGEIKEYIKDGLGIIFSKEFGLILFHLENVWINGEKFIPARTKQKLPVGSEVCFYDQSFQGDEYKNLSSDGIIHQAVAVFVGQRVEHLLKKISSPLYIRKLAQNRDSFMHHLNDDDFMRVALVRAKAQVLGYINDQVGILRLSQKEDGAYKKVLFHTDNVLVFKKPLSQYYQMSTIQHGRCTTSAKQLLPIGLNVSIDARILRMNGMRDISYQAIWVLAGTWPHSIHPTLLPGGAGSVFPSTYQVPDHHTFYYCDIELESKLQRKVNNFYDILADMRGQISFDDRGVIHIQGPQDHADWKSQFTGRKPPQNRKKAKRSGEKEEVSHLFKAPPPRPPIVPKEVKEEEEGSVAATAGSSCGGSVSGIGSAFSRPCSGMSMSSHSSGISRTSSFQRRNWYNSDTWQHGGLRIKPEVKSELDDEDGPSPPKRMKAELGV